MPAFPRLRKVLFVILDLLIPAGEVERDLGHVVDAGVADVPHRDPGVRVALLDLHEAFGGAQVRRRADADIPGAELLEEQKLLVGGSRRGLHAQLDAWRDLLHRRRWRNQQERRLRAFRTPSGQSPFDRFHCPSRGVSLEATPRRVREGITLPRLFLVDPSRSQIVALLERARTRQV